MFVTNPRRFNLYQALRYFFESYERRYGIITVTRENIKSHLAFGKTAEREYFMFDCSTNGPPMFQTRHGLSYILRCMTMARLLYCLVVTLRGGDFFIFEVDVTITKQPSQQVQLIWGNRSYDGF